MTVRLKTLASYAWIVLLCALPVGAGLWMTATYSVFVLSDHCWEFLNFSRELLDRGYPSWDALTQGINEHAVISFRILYALLGMLHPALVFPAPLSLAVFTYATHFFYVLIALSLASIAARTHAERPRWLKALLLFSSLFILFSFVQLDIWLQTFMAFAMTTFSAVAVLWLLFYYPRSRAALGASMLLALFASFGIANGFAVWAVALPLLWIDRAPGRRGLARIALWIAAGAASLAVYLAHQPPGLAPVPLDASTWHRFPAFVLTLLGSAWTQSWRTDEVLGLLLCAIIAFSLVRLRGMPRAAAPWVGLFLFALGSAFLIAWGREGMGIKAALESRYAAFTCVGWIAALYLCSLANRSGIASLFLAACLLVLNLRALPYAEESLLFYHQFASRGEACLRTYDIAWDDCLAFLYFHRDGATVRSMAPELVRLGMLQPLRLDGMTFADDALGSRGAIDGIVSMQNAGKPYLSASGWAMERRCGEAHVVLTAGKERTLAGYTMTVYKRPDVAQRYGFCARMAGWRIGIDPTLVAPPKDGLYELWILEEREKRLLPIGSWTDPALTHF
jgi:hypothetical protein